MDASLHSIQFSLLNSTRFRCFAEAQKAEDTVRLSDLLPWNEEHRKERPSRVWLWWNQSHCWCGGVYVHFLPLYSSELLWSGCWLLSGWHVLLREQGNDAVICVRQWVVGAVACCSWPPLLAEDALYCSDPCINCTVLWLRLQSQHTLQTVC